MTTASKLDSTIAGVIMIWNTRLNISLPFLVRFFTRLLFRLFPAGRRREKPSIPPILQVVGGAGLSRVQASSTWRGTPAHAQCREFPPAAGSQRSHGPALPTCCAKLVLLFSRWPSGGQSDRPPRKERENPEGWPVFCPLGHDIKTILTFMAQVYHPPFIACQGAI